MVAHDLREKSLQPGVASPVPPAETTTEPVRPGRWRARLGALTRSARPAPHLSRPGSAAWLAFLEVALIATVAVVFARPYLNLDPAQVPTGREYLSVIQSHHVWTRLRECGLCALWSGSLRGGAPAFVETHGSPFHPLVIITTLGWGVLNGSKLSLVGTIIMGGLAQWWLGRAFGLSPLARVWTGLLAVTAGFMAPRLELGTHGVALSTAACALVLPPLIAFSRGPTLRRAVVLGVTLALAAVAGQGYLQIGLACLVPLTLLLVPWGPGIGRRLLSGWLVALGLAFMLAAPLLVPLLHFSSQFAKDLNPGWRGVQPLAYIPLNLVIDDSAFYSSEALQKLPYPYLTVLFIGWIPVLLILTALTSRAGGRPGQDRALPFLLAAAFVALWVSSAGPFALVTALVPQSWLADRLYGIRFPQMIGGLAIPFLLVLAGLGLDRLMAAPWARARLALILGDRPRWQVSLHLLVVVPLLLALGQTWRFNSQWIATVPQDPAVERVIAALQTPDLQWVNTPFGEHSFIEPAVGAGLKLAVGVRAWNWLDRRFPEPVLEADRKGVPPGLDLTPIAVVDGIPIYAAPPGREYAAVVDPAGGRSVCTAQGRGGAIDVACHAPVASVLTVRENNWSGWQAWLDGEPAPLRPDPWLSVDLPPGEHTVRLRYRPWDVPLGLALCGLGVALAAYLWWRGGRDPALAGSGSAARGRGLAAEQRQHHQRQPDHEAE